MKMKIVLPVLLLTGLLFPVCGDDFEDFINVCSRVSSNYNRAVLTPGTRFDKEYRANLEHMKMLGSRIQTVIRRMKLGQDIDFPAMADELEQIYLGNQNCSGAKGDAKLHEHSESPEGLLKVLTEDVKALRKMEFNTDDGGSIKATLETRRKILEIRRLVDFFRKNYRKIYYRNQRKKDISLERIFKQRMIRMTALSSELMRIARSKYPDTLSRINLQSEAEALSKYFEAWCERKLQKAPRPPNKKNFKNDRNRNRNRPSNTNRRMDGLNSYDKLHAEIDVSLRNINDQLAQWDHAGFQSDEPLDSSSAETAGKDPAAPLMKDNPKKNYSAMDAGSLNELLARRRNEIIRSNRSMDGFDRDAERKYLLTLTGEQKRSYTDFLRDFQQQGYTTEQSVRSAVLKINTRIQMESKPLPAKDLIKILKALDKDEERRRDKNDIKFKLERRSVERD